MLPARFREPSLSTVATQPSVQRLPGWVWLLTTLLACWGANTANGTLTVFSIVSLPIMAQLLWRHGEPPVMAFAVGVQWLQASSAIFHSNSYDTTLARASGASEFETAAWLSLISVLVFACGVRLALVRCHFSVYRQLVTEGEQVDIKKAFLSYGFSFAISGLAGAIAFKVPQLTQIIFAFVTLKWAAIFILFYAVIQQRAGFALLFAVVLLELCIGLLGYFSSFKSVFFVLLIVALASPLALHGRRLIATSLILAALFCMGVAWSAIKGDYREFISQGANDQVVTVSTEQQIDKLQELLVNFTWRNVQEGLDAMLIRVSYIDFFAYTIMHVPANVPYENGALWFGAVKHVFTPRLLFPNKAAISDSERTAMYTGVEVAGVEQGTSIGIGYVGESYIDFGPVGMFFPILLFGMFCGFIYRLFVVRATCKLIGSAIATAILIFGACTIETSNIKLVGGNTMELLVMGVLYQLFDHRMHRWLTSRAG